MRQRFGLRSGLVGVVLLACCEVEKTGSDQQNLPQGSRSWVHLPDNSDYGSVAKGPTADDWGSWVMPLNLTLIKRLTRALSVLDDRGHTGPRLVDDALRLWQRVQNLLLMELIPTDADRPALELACYALGLPFAYDKSHRKRSPIRTRLRDRAILAIELLPPYFDQQTGDEQLLARAISLLEQMPERTPKIPEARLLADAVNLDDFGVSGLIVQTMQLCRQGDGLHQLIDGAEKRELYGYWDARLKDGFHFEPVRRIAQARLVNARQAIKMLVSECSGEKTEQESVQPSHEPLGE